MDGDYWVCVADRTEVMIVGIEAALYSESVYK